jgi:hypothetical protein
MITKKITHNDFLEIGKTNEYFLWHFLQKNQVENIFTIYSVFDEKNNLENHSQIKFQLQVDYLILNSTY